VLGVELCPEKMASVPFYSIFGLDEPLDRSNGQFSALYAALWGGTVVGCRWRAINAFRDHFVEAVQIETPQCWRTLDTILDSNKHRRQILH
jgi:hypothetical protein